MNEIKVDIQYNKTKVFITGISGFTGKHFEKHLLGLGYDVYGTTLDKTNLPSNHFYCDITKKNEIHKLLKNLNPDYIIHLAAISFVASKNISRIYEVNCLGTLNLLSSIKDLHFEVKKILIVSSAAVYGNVNSLLKETDTPKPNTHYGMSKYCMENICKMYFEDVNILIVRPFNYTGIGQEDKFIIPKIIRHFKDKKEIIELGNIDVYREFNSVDFVINVYWLLMQSFASSEIVNACSSDTYSIMDALSIMNKIAGYEIKVKINQKFMRSNEMKILRGSNFKLNKIIGKEKPMKNKNLKDILFEMYAYQ